jgi:GT2 family glycosyltransferase
LRKGVILNLTVGIATTGRRDLTSKLVQELRHQTRLPDEVIVSPAKDEDVDEALGHGLPFPVRIVRGPMGSSAQRNTIIRAATSSDIILFFDDDFIPAPTYLEQCAALFEREPDVVVATGTVFVDGINTAGVDRLDALALIERDRLPDEEQLEATYGGYGCNMAVRTAPTLAKGLAFDEALPLYGWLEDIDFSRHAAALGRIVRTNRCRGVHLGVKKGRTSGVRFGYSQVANPIYMVRKGSMRIGYAGSAVVRNLLANVALSFWPEPWVDRRGRLAGNTRAILDLMRGRLHPRNILDIQ